MTMSEYCEREEKIYGPLITQPIYNIADSKPGSVLGAWEQPKPRTLNFHQISNRLR